jgi:DNA-binding transcriptional ArsR family regulator
MKTAKDLNVDKVGRASRKIAILVHPERYKIAEMLNENGQMSVAQLIEKTNLSQTKVTDHLRHMYNHQLLLKQRVNKRIVFSVNRELIDYIADFTDKFHNK